MGEKEKLSLSDPTFAYPVARSLSRRIIFHSGPTNAGETYAAMESLLAAPTGVYAGPLRLLAMECYDHLALRGVRAALLTGEEEIGEGVSTHTACTVEALPVSDLVDVAVIDEVQLLADDERGSAWTRAILGAPAKEVHLVGAPGALPWIKAVLEATGEDVDVRHYTRRADLLPITEAVQQFQPKDAVVVFSRREVLRMRAELQSMGYKVAVIYGALPPEVRRREAAKFERGVADTLIATDAIGMGLNLPIRRVIFGALRKFDGLTSGD